MTNQGTLTIRVTTPEDHPVAEPIYLASDANNWQPNDERFRLSVDSADGLHTLVLSSLPDSLTYKFTRGAWASEEVNQQGQPIANRTWSNRADKPLIYARIDRWLDSLGRMDAELETINVTVWQEALWMPTLNRHRRIWVYLPPDYEKKRPALSRILYARRPEFIYQCCIAV